MTHDFCILIFCEFYRYLHEFFVVNSRMDKEKFPNSKFYYLGVNKNLVFVFSQVVCHGHVTLVIKFSLFFLKVAINSVCEIFNEVDYCFDLYQ